MRDAAVLAGGALVPGQDVLIEDGRIAWIKLTGEPPPPGAQVLPAAGGALLPGLIDLHTHLGGTDAPPWALEAPDVPWNLARWREAGVTTILDAGSGGRRSGGPERPRTGPDWAAAVAAGEAPGPRIIPAGARLSPRGGHTARVFRLLAAEIVGPLSGLLAPAFTRSLVRPVSTPAQARRAVEATAAAGGRVVKVDVEAAPRGARLIPLPVLQAVSAAAHERGMKVLAHVGAPEDVPLALAGGVDALMHIVHTGPLPPELARALADAEVPVVATLVMPAALAAQARGAWQPTALEAAYLDPAVLAEIQGEAGERWWDTRADFAAWLADVARAEPLLGENLRRLRDAGVTVLAGTDAALPGVVPGASLHRELALLVEAGLSPADALAAATWRAADFLGEPDLGRVEPGKIADLVLVEGDPLADIAATARIRCVIQAGQVVERRCSGGEPAACCL